MTRNETSKIVYTLKAAYTKYYEHYTVQDYDNLISVWESVLEDYTYEQVSIGLNIYMRSDTKGFPPSAGQIIDCITKLTPQNDMTALEAWHLVYKAIGNSTYHSDDEFAKLPEMCQRAVGSPANLREWAQMDTEKVNTIEQSHFIRSYDAVKQRTQDMAKIPERTRNLIDGATRRAISG